MTGIYFRSKNTIGSGDFVKLFDNLDLSNYKIKFGYQEFYDEKDGSEIDVKKDIELNKFIEFSTNNDFYTIFLEMFVYKKNDCIQSNPIDYKDYFKSRCIMALFIADSGYIDLYSKDPKILEKIMENISDERYYNQEYITDEKDGRTRFSVW